jgi:hypothetical protein
MRGSEPDDERVAEELAAIRGELHRIDGKSGTLLTLAAVEFAWSATSGPRAGSAAGVLRAAGLLLGAAAMLYLLFVVRPHLGPAWSGRPAAGGTNAPAEGVASWRRGELAVLSALVLTKYRRLRVAVGLLIGAVPLLVAAQLAAFLR